MNKYRKISKAGGITIPSDVRRELNIQAGDGFELDVSRSDGSIKLVRYRTRCIFCNDTENVKVFNGKGICRNCMERVDKEGIDA